MTKQGLSTNQGWFETKEFVTFGKNLEAKEVANEQANLKQKIKQTLKPKESKAIASQVEEEFKQRWIEKRAAELMTRGVAPDIARGQAIEEFRLNYSYTTAAGK